MSGTTVLTITNVFKRIATSKRNGNCPSLDYAAFDAVLCDPKSGLTHAALVGERKQSLVDAERLLSYHVVESLQRQGYKTEAEYVKVSFQNNLFLDLDICHQRTAFYQRTKLMILL